VPAGVGTTLSRLRRRLCGKPRTSDMRMRSRSNKVKSSQNLSGPHFIISQRSLAREIPERRQPVSLLVMASYMSGVQSVMKTLRLPIATRPRPVFIGSQMQRILVAQQCERRRMYAIGKAKPVEPPEYLDEGERRVFDKIKETLQPTKLEVCRICITNSKPCANRDIGSRHFWWLWINVRAEHCVRSV
jgi:hypothetical protein